MRAFCVHLQVCIHIDMNIYLCLFAEKRHYFFSVLRWRESREREKGNKNLNVKERVVESQFMFVYSHAHMYNNRQ